MKQHANRYFKQVTAVWDSVIKEEHRNPHQAVSLLSTEVEKQPGVKTLHAFNCLCCKPHVLQPCAYLFGRARGQSWFQQVSVLSPTVNFCIKIEFQLEFS